MSVLKSLSPFFLTLLKSKKANQSVELFKYFSDAKPFSYNLLEKNELYFSPPKDFNDLYDSGIPLNFSKIPRKRIVDHIVNSAQNLGASGTREELTKALKSQIEDAEKLFRSDLPSVKEAALKGQMEFINQYVGVSCLTRRVDNLVMWSHYSNCHNGFVVGFWRSKLEEEINFKNQIYLRQNLKDGDKLKLSLKPVIYAKDFPTIGLYHDMENRYVPLITKGFDWGYEEEERLILLNGAKHNMTVSDSVFSKVILGAKSSTHLESLIKRILLTKEAKIPLYKTKKKLTEFGLELEEVSY